MSNTRTCRWLGCFKQWGVMPRKVKAKYCTYHRAVSKRTSK